MSALHATAWRRLAAGTVHEDSFVRCEAARLLGALGDRRAVPLLMRQLARDAHTTKITAIYALGALADRRAAPLLRRIADDPGVFRFPGMHNHDMIRLAAALELARWNDASGVAAVEDLLRLPPHNAFLHLGPAILAAPRTTAVAPLRQRVSLDFVLANRRSALNAGRHFTVAQCLAHFPVPEARRQLVADLAHFSRYVRPVAAASLLQLEASPANRRLVARRAAQERTPHARLRFAVLLHQHGLATADAAIARGLRSRDPFVRATALDAAAELRQAGFAPQALRLRADPDFYVRICAADALAVLAPERAAAALAPLLGDPHPRVALQAAKSLLASAFLSKA